jgi:hypothetical protein
MYQQTTEVTRSSRVLAQRSSGVTSTNSNMVINCRPRGMGVTRMNYRRPSLQDIQGITRHSQLVTTAPAQRYGNTYARALSS